MVFFVMRYVRNVINSARWFHMLEALENRFHFRGYLLRIFRYYLKNRTVLNETREAQRKMKITLGVA